MSGPWDNYASDGPWTKYGASPKSFTSADIPDTPPRSKPNPDEGGALDFAKGLPGAVATMGKGAAAGSVANIVAAVRQLAARGMGADPEQARLEGQGAGEKVQSTLMGEPPSPAAQRTMGTLEKAGAATKLSGLNPSMPLGQIAPGAFTKMGQLMEREPKAPIVRTLKDDVRDASQKSGYITPPESGIKARISEMTGRTRNEKILSEANAENAAKKLGAEVGAQGELSTAEFDRLKEDAGKAYDAMVKAAPKKLQPTENFYAPIRESLKEINETLARNPVANKVLVEPKKLLESFQKQTDYPAEATLKDIQNQRKWAKADFQAGRNEMGTARMAIANKLEDMFQENIGDPKLVKDFQDARTRFAKIYMLERITNDVGNVNLQKLASLSETKAYKGVLTGEFKTAADFAKEYAGAARKVTGEPAPKLSMFDALFAGGAALGGHYGVAATELGARLAVPAALRKGWLQNKSPKVGELDPNAPIGAQP